jgi:hypothetical protein
VIDDRDGRFVDLERAVEGSLAGRAWVRTVALGESAARLSAAVTAISRERDRWNARPLTARFRHAGVALLAFSVADLLLARMVPEASAPGFPAFVWGPASALGIALVWGSRSLSAAWLSRSR